MAVLTPGRAPERVVAEAVALAARGPSPLRLVVLRRTVGFSTDAALVAAVERSADTTQRELLTRAATMISDRVSGDRVSGDRVSGDRVSGDRVSVDVVRMAGEDFDAPSRRLTARVVRVARLRGADVIVMPATLLTPTTATPAMTIIAVDDVHDVTGKPAPASADAVAEEGVLRAPLMAPAAIPARLGLPHGSGDHAEPGALARIPRTWWQRPAGVRRARPGALGLDRTLQPSAIQQDSPPIGALVDAGAVALVGPHGTVARGTGHLRAGGTDANDDRFPLP